MQTLLDCRSCSGFIPPGAGACPCCGAAIAPQAARITPLRAALGLAVTGLMAVSLMACYGLPMCEEGDKVDEDKDGYFADRGNCYIEEADCNDGDATIHPGADDPAGDGIDQNCDFADGTASTTSSGGSSSGGSNTGGTGGSTCSGGTGGGGTGGATPCGGTGGM